MPGPNNKKKKNQKKRPAQLPKKQVDTPPPHSIDCSSPQPGTITPPKTPPIQVQRQITTIPSPPASPPRVGTPSTTTSLPNIAALRIEEPDPLHQSTLPGPSTTPPPPEFLPPPLILHDPGNGPRVLDVELFLESPYADPISLSDPQCLDFSQPDVLPILKAVLPFEAALILHYNKTRLKGRICPACRRLYRLGDTLQPHMPDGSDLVNEGPQTPREQWVSGICSWMCFAACSFRWPGCIDAWGNMAIDISDETIDKMNGPGDGTIENDEGLGQFLRMTRNEGLGIELYRQAYREALEVLEREEEAEDQEQQRVEEEKSKGVDREHVEDDADVVVSGYASA